MDLSGASTGAAFGAAGAAAGAAIAALGPVAAVGALAIGASTVVGLAHAAKRARASPEASTEAPEGGGAAPWQRLGGWLRPQASAIDAPPADDAMATASGGSPAAGSGSSPAPSDSAAAASSPAAGSSSPAAAAGSSAAIASSAAAAGGSAAPWQQRLGQGVAWLRPQRAVADAPADTGASAAASDSAAASSSAAASAHRSAIATGAVGGRATDGGGEAPPWQRWGQAVGQLVGGLRPQAAAPLDGGGAAASDPATVGGGAATASGTVTAAPRGVADGMESSDDDDAAAPIRVDEGVDLSAASDVEMRSGEEGPGGFGSEVLRPPRFAQVSERLRLLYALQNERSEGELWEAPALGGGGESPGRSLSEVCRGVALERCEVGSTGRPKCRSEIASAAPECSTSAVLV